MLCLGFDIPLWAVILGLVGVVYYWYMSRNFGVFEKLGVKGPKPYPFIGTIFSLFTKGIIYHDTQLQKKYGKVVGIYQGREPMLMVYDTDMLKQILVKQFSSFTNRRSRNINQYPLNKLMTALQDDHWRHVRNLVTPAFSGKKLRHMTEQINKCAGLLADNLGETAASNETFDFKEYSGNYTMDVIASTAFGLEIDSQKEPNCPFVTHAKASIFTRITDPRVIIIILMPFLMKHMSKLGVSLFPKKSLEFFSSVINETIKMRENPESADAEGKTDFIQLMVNAHLDDIDPKDIDEDEGHSSSDLVKDKTGVWSKRGLTHEEVLGQALLFFLAGFETTSTTLSFLGYNLATNPDCQDRLFREVDSVMEGKEVADYDLVKQMPYMEMCLEESLRLYPPGPRVDRLAGEDVTINGVFIPKGLLVGVPIYVLHHDPELWEDPEKFDPERFTPEAKAERDPFTYMPFGMGPRNCIAMRLALLEIKVAMTQVLRHYKFVTSPETEIPIKLGKTGSKAVNGVKLRVERRE